MKNIFRFETIPIDEFYMHKLNIIKLIQNQLKLIAVQIQNQLKLIAVQIQNQLKLIAVQIQSSIRIGSID